MVTVTYKIQLPKLSLSHHSPVYLIKSIFSVFSSSKLPTSPPWSKAGLWLTIAGKCVLTKLAPVRDTRLRLCCFRSVSQYFGQSTNVSKWQTFLGVFNQLCFTIKNHIRNNNYSFVMIMNSFFWEIQVWIVCVHWSWNCSEWAVFYEGRQFVDNTHYANEKRARVARHTILQFSNSCPGCRICQK